jgi:hypothetical protein
VELDFPGIAEVVEGAMDPTCTILRAGLQEYQKKEAVWTETMQRVLDHLIETNVELKALQEVQKTTAVQLLESEMDLCTCKAELQNARAVAQELHIHKHKLLNDWQADVRKLQKKYVQANNAVPLMVQQLHYNKAVMKAQRDEISKLQDQNESFSRLLQAFTVLDE